MSKKTIAQATTNLLLRIHVRPNAKTSAVREVTADNEVRVDVAADAQDGKANQALIDLLRGILKIPSSQLEIVHGHRQRDKVIRLTADASDADTVIARLRSEIVSK